MVPCFVCSVRPSAGGVPVILDEEYQKVLDQVSAWCCCSNAMLKLLLYVLKITEWKWKTLQPQPVNSSFKNVGSFLLLGYKIFQGDENQVCSQRRDSVGFQASVVCDFRARARNGQISILHCAFKREGLKYMSVENMFVLLCSTNDIFK